MDTKLRPKELHDDYLQRAADRDIGKIKKCPLVSLHVDTTGNIVKKLNGKEVYLTSCIFRGSFNLGFLLSMLI